MPVFLQHTSKMLFQKLLFFTQGYSGAANANIDADDHENGGVNAKFAEKGRDVQFGDIYDRMLLEIPVAFKNVWQCLHPTSSLFFFSLNNCYCGRSVRLSLSDVHTCLEICT